MNPIVIAKQRRVMQDTAPLARAYHCLAMVSLLLCTALTSLKLGASTVLDYPVETLRRYSAPAMPQSVFHSSENAAQEARTILEAWQTEPMTLAWTRIQLGRHVKHKIMPTRGARGLALMHVAMHDAYQLAIEQSLEPSIAVSMAAAQVLGYLFVAEEAQFDRIVLALMDELLRVQGAQASDTLQRAWRLGFQVGRRVVAHGDTDGAQKGWNGIRLQWYGEGRYYGPGTWEPTPPYFYYPPDEPFAPGWRTWVLGSASEYRPTPPAFGSPRYVKDVEEVLAIRASLTDEQRKIARYWVDGHGSETPAGHWNSIAIKEVLSAKLDTSTTARLFAQLNIAMADTFVAVWDTKYFYWTARPITAAKSVLGADLKPLLLTPPFPSYVSGHAGFSGAAARVLGVYVPQHATALNTMAEEATHSRLLGGIHFRHDNEDGLVLGRRVAEKVLANLPLK
jgi:PAP2 superfamily